MKARVLSSQVFARHGASQVPRFAPNNAARRRIDPTNDVAVAEITYLTWTADNPLRHTIYVGLREDKPANQVRRER
jgi:ATP-dependent DNA ligase